MAQGDESAAGGRAARARHRARGGRLPVLQIEVDGTGELPGASAMILVNAAIFNCMAFV